MTGKRLLVLLALVPLVLCVAGSRSAKADPISTTTPAKERLSPERDMVVEFRDVATSAPFTENSREIWLVDAKKHKQKKLLYTYHRAADVLFSPNEKWLLVDDHVGSNSSETHLFEHVSGVEYRKSDLDPEEAVWRFFFEQMKLQRDPKKGPLAKDYDEMDHFYIHSVRWSTDSDAILFSLDGHNSGDPRPWAEGWLCVYDLRNQKVTLDLNVFNRNAGGLGNETADPSAEDTSATQGKAADVPQIPNATPALLKDGAPVK
jgi:hypothetical protein